MTITLRPELLTAERFAPYGNVIEAGTRSRAPMNAARFERFDDLAKIDIADGGRVAVSVARCRIATALPWRIDTVERHPLGSQAFVLSPLTVDRAAVRQLLAEVVPNIAGQGTALGDAIALGAKKLRERPEGSRVMILIADGDNTAGLFPPIEAAKVAARAGVRIYVIGVGSTESVPNAA